MISNCSNLIVMKKKYLAIIILFSFSTTALQAQTEILALPKEVYQGLVNSTNGIDIVFLKGAGGSMTVDEEKSVKYFNSFFTDKSATKTNAQPDGNIMWLSNGREYISARYFVGETTGYAVFEKDGVEYVNEITEEGNTFFKSKIK